MNIISLLMQKKNNNTTITRIDVYETLCPQQMLVHEGCNIKNWGGECRDVTNSKLQSQNNQIALHVFYTKNNNRK